jgi:hypothetical protein
MFGYHQARRDKKRAKRDKIQIEKETEMLKKQRPDIEKENEIANKEAINKNAQEAKVSRMQAREEGRKYAEDVLNRDVQGLNPAKKNAMQYEANKHIQRQHQQANRKLLGEQGQRGIVGKGGVGYAQQKDLQRMANDAYGQSQRDMDKLDADLAMKKLAAMFNIEQGEAAQSQLDKQVAIDELNLSNEQKRQKYLEDQFNRLFSRL